ncbi:DUF4105 domain-containing protein [Bacteriovorax stolpii]|uniref:Uncharacterized protein n=1 Tax=Bacteriovorax stolpii TaxID=960 RepID=A0A2K9NYH1_BACTC|nr:DUF4105 domain-containing protein [Bacteriovorax stolpii]AUN99764.1 hypothetical protein C0V70_16950 [Bacteriovorax stolpii]QDK40242.1 DUF4105 domain-containing protein [Bacteriovorax stolpii]TDP54349.1 uncharacterized protein DUF4105 [Bacteriovorax stolpii]
MTSTLRSALFFFLFFSVSYAQDQYYSPVWKNLLHYNRALLGVSSDVDDPAFFVAKDGKNNPLHELAENVLKINAKDKEYICRFPARFKYLNRSQNLNIDESILKSCEKYQQYLADHYPKTVHLVFSSYYLESPASAFGHTFLRFSKNESLSSDKRSELLDVGINYGASNTSSNPLVYTVYGIFGGFQGTFSSIPYFYKIREYNDFESRDLWSYELNFTEAQKEKLLDHLWELGGTWYYYYFFTGNCSQKIMALLDGVEPSWKLLDSLPKYIIPAETIKALYNVPGLVNHITFRPSKRRMFQEAYGQLSTEEKRVFKQVVDHDDWNLVQSKDISTASAAKILDVIIEFIDYKYSKEVLFEKGPKYEWKQKLLAIRSQNPEKGADLQIPPPKDEEPHLSHPSRKLKLMAVKTEHSNDLTFKVSHRFALHDFTDPTLGSPKLSSINFFKVDLEASKKALKVDSVTAVEVASFNPWGSYFYPVSIYGIIDYSKDRMNLCGDCRVFKGSVASGPSWSFFNDRFIPFIFASSDFMYATAYNKNFEINAGIYTGVILRVSDWFSSFARYKKAYALFNKKENYMTEVTGQFHHTKHVDTSIEASFSDKRKQYMVGFNFFY